MTEPVKPPSRRYRSDVRAEQASLTKSRILDAAAQLFQERGYGGTTLNAVAEAAGVATETIYASVGGKRRLLEGVLENAITPGGRSPDETVATMMVMPTAHERLRAYVAFCCGVLARTSPFHVVLRGAADGEDFAVTLRSQLLDERLARQTRHLRLLVGDELRPGLTFERAAESFCALSSPEMHHLLTSDLAWSREAHEGWLAALAQHELLGDARSSPGTEP
jgi:AcrR family transcriptional regulator